MARSNHPPRVSQSPNAAPELTVAIPVFNEAASLPALREALEATLAKLGLTYEVLLVDDGSADASWAEIAAWCRADPHVRGFRFARNFGKEAALSAGLYASRGAAVVLMDADLQHPPALIADFVARWREGYEMVYAVRATRAGDSALRRSATHVFYRLFRRVAEVDLPPGAGDFRLIDRRVVDTLNRLPERLRFMKGLYAWAGARHTGVPYDPPPRRYGQSAMSLRRLTTFGLDGIVAFSRIPLAISGWAGAAVALCSIAVGVYLALRTMILGVDVPGYASIMVGVMLLGGVQLLALGILGAYVGRIYEEIKERPLYVVAEEMHGGEDAAPATETGSHA